MRRLYVGWREATDEQRRRIEQDPWLYLKVLGQAGAEQPPDEDERSRARRELLEALDAVVGVCRRAAKRLGIGVEGMEQPGYRAKLHRAMSQARLAFEQLDERMQECIDAGP